MQRNKFVIGALLLVGCGFFAADTAFAQNSKRLIESGRLIYRSSRGKGLRYAPDTFNRPTFHPSLFLQNYRWPVMRPEPLKESFSSSYKTTPLALAVEKTIDAAVARRRKSLFSPVSVESKIREHPLRKQIVSVAGQALHSNRLVYFPGKKLIDAVIFDMDGTLLDSLPAWKNSASNFLRSQGIEPPAGIDQEMEKQSLAAGARIIKERFNLPQTEKEILALTLEPIRQHYFTDIQAKPGVEKLLKSLHAQGIKICVATASDGEFALGAFERLNLMQYIDFIITCDDVGIGKRSAVIYNEAREILGTSKDRTLVVEDALYALKTAREAGYLVAGVADSNHSEAHNEALRANSLLYIDSFENVILP